MQHATEGYLEFLRLGGRLRFANLSQNFIGGILRRQAADPDRAELDVPLPRDARDR